MIIDTHMHMYDGAWPPDCPKGLSAKALLEIMDKNDIERVWISSATALARDFIESNDRLYEFTKTDEKRIVHFCTVNINYYGKAVDEVKRCAEVLGTRGLKIHPWLSGSPLATSTMYRVIETCIRYGLPILFHDGTPPYSESMQIANLAELYPEAKIILGHAGLYDLYRSAVAAARRFKNIYLCICGPAVGDARYILDNVDHDRIIYGSDGGFLPTATTVPERLNSILYASSDETLLNKVLYSNAISLID